MNARQLDALLHPLGGMDAGALARRRSVIRLDAARLLVVILAVDR